jgi:hypothetical protein
MRTIIRFGLIIVVACVMYQLYSGQRHALMNDASAQVALPNNEKVAWPPETGKPYPDLVLKDHRGNTVRLSDFKGRVMMIEPIGMTCPACNAFSGAHKKGRFQNVTPQANLKSIEEYFPRFAGGITINDPRVVKIHLLLYNMQMQGPSVEDAQAWAKHFGLDSDKNSYVLAGGPELVNAASYAMIPGFQLVDKRFILRADSSGHNPRVGLNTLLALVPTLLQE